MIAIVGGGWFGCHLGCVLKKKGVPLRLFEQQNRLFGGASGYNQNRLHLGFHYPRSAITREQSREGFYQFLDTYPDLSQEIENNIYAVVKHHSFLDFDTYKLVMSGSNLNYEVLDPSSVGLDNVEGCLRCEERVVCTNKTRDYFSAALSGEISLNTRFETKEDFDAIINCTYQTWNPASSEINFRYEPCVVLVYSSAIGSSAITLMDGPFHSIYPFEDNLFTAYSVRLSRLNNFPNFSEAVATLNNVNSEQIECIRREMEQEISVYFPAFKDSFRHVDVHKSIRSYAINSADARTCKVTHEGNTIHVFSGKIDSIFHAENEVMKCLESCCRA